MRYRSLLPILALAVACFSSASDIHDAMLVIDDTVKGGFKEITGLESEIEVIEYKDGDDSITHKRAGKAKYKNIVLKRGWSGAGCESFDSFLHSALAGESTARKSGSVIYLDREGNEVERASFGGFGDISVFCPGSGALQGQDTDFAILLRAYRTQGVIHRDLAARNVLKSGGGAIVKISDFGMSRVMDCAGTSSFQVRVATGDLDGDGVPDAVESVNSGNIRMLFGESEIPFLRRWQAQTEAAAEKGVPMNFPIRISWPTKDGWLINVDFKATFLGALASNGTISVTAATEEVAIKPIRVELK